MNLIEFIGFVISFLAFVFLMIRRAIHKRNPEKLKEFLKSIDADEEEIRHEVQPLPPIPKPKTIPKLKAVGTFDTAVDKRQLATKIQYAEDAYTLKEKKRESRAYDLLNIHSKQQMILYYEIFSRPKGFR